MPDNITKPICFVIGYVITYLAREAAWHFIAYEIPDKHTNLMYEYTFEPTNKTVPIK
jgi:hypothetical protein